MVIIPEKILVFCSEYFDLQIIFLHQERDKVKLCRRFLHLNNESDEYCLNVCLVTHLDSARIAQKSLIAKITAKKTLMI